MRKQITDLLAEYEVRTAGNTKVLALADEKIPAEEELVYICPSNIKVTTRNTNAAKSYVGVLAITDRYIYVIHQVLGQCEYKRFPVSHMKEVRYKANGWTGAKFDLVLSDVSINFLTGYKKPLAARLDAKLHALMAAAKDTVQALDDEGGWAAEHVDEKTAAAPEPEGSLLADKRSKADRSYIDEVTGEIHLRGYKYQSDKKKGKEWVVGMRSITVNDGANQKTYPIAQISNLELSFAKASIKRMNLYIGSGNISAIGGTTTGNTPTEFIFYHAYEHEIAMKMREYIMHYPAQTLSPAPGEPAQAPEQPASVADELRKLKELLDEGILTEEEFSRQKQKLLQS